MAYIKGYEYDIFISYSHLDNQKLFDKAGWVERFRTELSMMIAQRIGKPDAVKIWWDNRNLDGSTLFDQSIDRAIRQSAILLSITSAAYFKSDYCLKELKIFYDKVQQEPAGLKVGDRSRIINVLLNNISYEQWPKELNGTTGFSFNDAKDSNDLGDPLEPGEPMKNQLKELRNAIIGLVNDFVKLQQVQQIAPGTAATVEKEEPADFSIYFGDVADSLRSTRKRTIAELEKKGFKILHDLPPPFEAAAHELAVREKLATADLSVHLLDQYPGREIDEEGSLWYPQKQAELGIEFAKSKFIWIPAEMDITKIEETPYQDFMQALDSGKQSAKNLEYVRGVKGSLTQDISDFAEKLKASQMQADKLKQQQLNNGNKGKIGVLLDTHLEDQLYAYELSKSLLENQIQPYINPQEDVPTDNANMLGDRISQVSKLIFFYGKVDWKWVEKRVNAAVKLVVNNNYAIDEFFIFMLPPHKNPNDILFKHRFVKVNLVDNSSTAQLDNNALQAFFKTLKTVA